MIDIAQDVIQKIAGAQRIAVLTGAGISAESGVPTFRGKGGIWNNLKPEELASMDAFLQNPEIVWQWYEHRRKIIGEVKPNAAHLTLAAMEKSNAFVGIATQNVDGLHHRAGSSNVHELHGNILRNRCNACGKLFNDVDISAAHKLPTCECGGRIRPDVVWFGEMLPQDVLEKAFDDARNADVYFSIGTAAVVFPAAQLPMHALQHGAFVLEINTEPTLLTPKVHLSCRGKAGEVLPEIWRAVEKEKRAN